MAYHGNPFTPIQDRAIRQGYDAGKTIAEIASRIGRSIGSTGARARYLGLIHPFGKMRADSLKRRRLSTITVITSAIPTLAYVPGIILTEDSRYRMRTP